DDDIPRRGAGTKELRRKEFRRKRRQADVDSGFDDDDESDDSGEPVSEFDRALQEMRNLGDARRRGKTGRRRRRRSGDGGGRGEYVEPFDLESSRFGGAGTFEYVSAAEEGGLWFVFIPP